MKTETIKREASDKTKGFRLQKLRAVQLMLEKINPSSREFFYTAIENVEDVSQTTINLEENGQVTNYFEEDKNYEEGTNFTLFSKSVKNTLVSFFDIYAGQWSESEHLHLGFYTTASIGKESKKIISGTTELKPPKEPILKLLSSKEDLSDDVISYIKEATTQEYASQYESKDSKANLETLKSFDNKKFSEFLAKINWKFESEDEIKLKATVLDLIKKSHLFNIRHANKEEMILSILMERLDERQNLENLTQKIISSPEIDLIFKEAESEINTLAIDPVWCHLDELEKDVSDRRNLKEKIEAVCPSYPIRKINLHSQVACRSKTEQNASNKSFLSLKYRVYEACQEHLVNTNTSKLNEDKIDLLFEELKN